MAVLHSPLTNALILFTRLDERYQQLLQERGWQSPPPLDDLIRGFGGKLTEALSAEELCELEPFLLQMTSRYTTRIYNQQHDGYQPRVLDVAYVILCEEALQRIRCVCHAKKNTHANTTGQASLPSWHSACLRWWIRSRARRGT